MYVGVELNVQLFTLRVVENIPNKLLTGYSCKARVSLVQLTSSVAIKGVYKDNFKTLTEYYNDKLLWILIVKMMLIRNI